MRYPARYYQLLLPVLQAAGTDPEPLLAELGLQRQRLADPASTLSAVQVQRLVEAVLAADASPDLALRLGRRIKPSSHEMLGLAMMSADTLGDALQLAVRYWPLITPLFGVRAQRRGQSLGLRWTALSAAGSAMPDPVLVRFHGEALLAGMHEELRFLLGELPAGYRLELPAEWLSQPSRYRLLRPAVLRAHAGTGHEFSLWVPTAALATPLLLADETARRAAEQRCQILLAQLSAGSGLAVWVRNLLSQADPLPGQAQLAELLHLSTRSLHRRLAAEGESFRNLLDEERYTRACAMLRETQLPVTSIALALGYSDPANFGRAFRRRAGVPPLAYRHAARASG